MTSLQAPCDAVVPERRRFLLWLWKGLGIVAGAELVGVLLAFFSPRETGGEAGSGVVSAGPVSEFTPGSVTPFPQGRFYLVRLMDGGFLALAATCTHLGCTVPWNEKDQSFPCPCHASKFDLRGEVLSPPAPRALDLLPLVIEGGVVQVSTGRRIERARFEPGQVTYL